MYASDSGIRRFGVSRRSVMAVPVSCRRYTLNSERRSVNSDTAIVLLGERNAGRRMEAARLKLTLAEPTVSWLEPPQMLRSSPQSTLRTGRISDAVERRVRRELDFEDARLGGGG